MKVRGRFVSNSSSGSFILLGWELGRNITSTLLTHFFGIKEEELENKEFFHAYDNDGIYFGIELFYESDNCERYVDVVDLEKLQEILPRFIQEAKACGFNVKEARVINGGFEC